MMRAIRSRSVHGSSAVHPRASLVPGDNDAADGEARGRTMTSSQASRTILPPPPLQYPRTKAEREKRKNRLTLRNTLAVVAFLVLLPLVYVFHLVVYHPTPYHHYHQSSVIHKQLQGFHDRPSRSTRGWNSSKRSRIKRRRPVLTAYLEPPGTLEVGVTPLPPRNTTANRLRAIQFPTVINCSSIMQDFPIDDYPEGDPFLPWLHDFFPSLDGKQIHFVAQNKRRCDTGEGETERMKYWEPQVSLFQPIPIVEIQDRVHNVSTTSYRLASSHEEATYNATRFQCRFHHGSTISAVTTLSMYPFDYEYVNWRKKKTAMFERTGKDSALFWLSQLLFSCPVPIEFRQLLLLRNRHNTEEPAFYVDLIPIRTLARTKHLLREDQLGKRLFVAAKSSRLDLNESYGTNHVLPPMDDAGRWQNIPICQRGEVQTQSRSIRAARGGKKTVRPLPPQEKKHRLVACTWTSASYTRRGDAVTITDSAKRLREWIEFHLLVGVDHVVVYDNTNITSSDSSVLRLVTESFDKEQVTYHSWPCKICNNNRPNHKNPGERSSQYAAESSCRLRYSEMTEWMASLDTDEYFVPMRADKNGAFTWHTILDEMDAKNISIMKFRSSRGKPRIELMEELQDQSVCFDPVPGKQQENKKSKLDPCLGPLKDKTFLQVYNCDFIRPPKPDRFARAMKQIYRPEFVQSHFVHYSTVTADMSQPYSDFKRLHPDAEPPICVSSPQWERDAPDLFMDELTQGALIHARSVLPHETGRRSAECYTGSSGACMMGFRCEDDVPFLDEVHKKNVCKNKDGGFCNCWTNRVVDEVLVPELERRLERRLQPSIE